MSGELSLYEPRPWLAGAVKRAPALDTVVPGVVSAPESGAAVAWVMPDAGDDEPSVAVGALLPTVRLVKAM